MSVLPVRRIINTTNAPQAIGPYSHAVAAGDTVYLSGMVGIDPSTSALVEGGIEAETHQAFKNIKAVLKEAGLEYKHVVKCTVLLASIAEFQKMNDVYATYFKGDYPARAAYQVVALPKNARVEIECIAVRTQ